MRRPLRILFQAFTAFTTVHVASVIAVSQSISFSIPSSAPASAIHVDPSLLSLSIEFFAFPEYMTLDGTKNCLKNIEDLRGVAPAVRIGGTTQYDFLYLVLRNSTERYISSRDRATYDASLSTAVNYTVASPADAPDSLTFGPSFFSLADELKGDVTIGLNRQLDNIENTRLAAQKAVGAIESLLVLELGNEPDRELSCAFSLLDPASIILPVVYSASSPIAHGAPWTPTTDGESQKTWFTELSTTVSYFYVLLVTCSCKLPRRTGRQYFPRSRIHFLPVLVNSRINSNSWKCDRTREDILRSCISAVCMRRCVDGSAESHVAQRYSVLRKQIRVGCARRFRSGARLFSWRDKLWYVRPFFHKHIFSLIFWKFKQPAEVVA